MSTETASSAPTIKELLRIARSIGDKDLEEMIAEVYAKIAPVVRERSSFSVQPGTSFYEEMNYCSLCGRVYPKEIRTCPECHQKVRTRSRM